MTRNRAATLLLAVALAGSVFAWNEVRREREFRRLIAVGDASLAAGRTSEAVEAFSGAVALRPDSMLGYLKRGDTYRRRSEFAAALRDLQQAAALDPAAPRPRELLGDVNLALDRNERAAEEYARFVAIEDRSPRVLYKLALARYREGKAGAALESLRQALALDERFSEAHYLLGLCLRERQREQEAVRSVARAIAITPAFAAARAELADLYISLGRTREALQQLEALAALEPSRAERLIEVALAYAHAGRTEAAVVTLGRAMDQHPGEPAVYAALGRVWLEAAEGRQDPAALRKAVEALERATSGETPAADALACYGQALFLSGDAAGAERVLNAATARPPVDPMAFIYLAAAAGRLGHQDTARIALARYSQVGEPRPDAGKDRILEVLELQRQLRGAPQRATPSS